MENEIMKLSIEDIKKIIPHRYPFLMVDKIVEMIPGVKAVGIKNVTYDEYFFQGHFPDESVMPGVLIIEALAQTGAAAVLCKEEFKGRTAYLAGVNKAKFRKKVVPGDTLRLETDITKLKAHAGIGNGTAFVNGEKVCEAEIIFMIG